MPAGGKRNKLDRVLLVSAPWPLYNRPSIQLGALKAHLAETFPGLGVEALHLYLKVARAVGYRTYQALSLKTWPAEAVSAALLHPERLGTIEKVFRRVGRGDPVLRRLDFEALVRRVGEVSEEELAGRRWDECGLIGFSLCLCQLTSSLYCIRRIKERSPEALIVAGGSLVAGEAGLDLAGACPEIDYLVQGEGERPLAGLVGYLRGEGGFPSAGVVGPGGTGGPVPFDQTADLTALPIPDYDDYFALLASFPPEARFFPALPVELSRGCWWSGRAGRGCAFCNLNRQWEGYRVKDPARAAAEIDFLTGRHKVLSVSFMDNLLPVKGTEALCRGLAGLRKNLSLFGEIRADTPLRVLEAMRGAGFGEVQIGIEALSTRLLKKMNKGLTAAANLEAMRNCEELGLVSDSNLILEFPGSDEEDAAETLRALDYAAVFRPLRPVRFWLGQGSPVQRDPGAFGLRSVSNHPNYAAFFPPALADSVRFMVQHRRGDLARQRRLWAPVRKIMAAWAREYDRLHRGPVRRPILGYQDGGDFMIITRRLSGGEAQTHRLEGPSREIYLYCRQNRTLKDIRDRFPRLGEDQVRAFLLQMQDRKLMFEEGGRRLSLAVSLDRRG
ncbi:MAG: RiPP maturation radical SAM C-methyltransferase [Thermodesulfobacteriota bacterium]